MSNGRYVLSCALVAAAAWLGACGGSSKSGSAPPPQTPQASPAPQHEVTIQSTPAGKSAGQSTYAEPPPARAPSDTGAAEAAAPPAAAPAPEPGQGPSMPDARARYSRANVQLSEARRQLDVATGQRDCANACRALDSMERAAQQVCELARSADEKRTCKSAEDQVGAARDRVHSVCGNCPKQPK